MTLINDSLLSGSAMPRILAASRALLVGRTITSVGYIESGGGVWPCLVLDNGTVLTVSQDDEGNGPGSLFIDPEDGRGETLCRTHAIS